MQPPELDINARIWQVISLIPSGKVSTYGDVARQAGLAGAARRVGYSLKILPPETKIPWHRVLNVQGKISLPTMSASSSIQRERLEKEGVVFRANKTVDMRVYRWAPGTRS